MDLVSGFVPTRANHLDAPEIGKMRNTFKISGKNMNDVLENPFYKRKVFDSQNDELNKKSALIINMIAKSRPDFDEKRILMRYRRLFNLCEN
ncbi:MAG: hypothetical protein KC493_04020 [Bacteriovoracaceae bacterium]|nr:hypothetical protein [Bacteriovoracaceae bacterium]